MLAGRRTFVRGGWGIVRCLQAAWRTFQNRNQTRPIRRRLQKLGLQEPLLADKDAAAPMLAEAVAAGEVLA